MKICYIADQTSIHTQRWLKCFAKAGHEIFLMPHSEADIAIENVTMLDKLPKLSYKSMSFFPTLLKAKSIIRKLKPDILHAHFVEQFGWLGALVDFHPYVLTAWGSDIYRLPYSSRLGIGKLLTQYTLKKADILTSISESLKTEMVQLKAKKEKINIIHWGVDLDKFKPNINVSEFRKGFGAKNRPIIYSNRYFDTHYNIDVILRAFACVLKKISNAILILQNPGGKLHGYIEILIRDLGIYKSVFILPRFEHCHLPTLYAMADIYVSVPSYDAACISLTEAMACGAVPIISEVPGPMEWVKDGYNGKVVPVKNSEALANAICNLIQNTEKRKLYRNRNIDLINKRGDQKYWMDKMNNIYNNLNVKYNS